MNLLNLFSKYYKQLPLIRKTITDNYNLLKFDPFTSKHLFSITECTRTYLYDHGLYIHYVQHDYYKTKNGNYVELMRFLNKKSDGRVFVYKRSEKQINEDYANHVKYPEEVKLIIDNYHKVIEYTEL